MRFAIFPLRLSKVLRLPRKSDARSYEVLHLSRKIILANLQIWCSKTQPFSGNQRPDLLTSLMNMSFVLRLPRKMHLCRSSSNVPCLPSFFDMLQNLHVLLTFDKVHIPCACHAKPHLNLQKWSKHAVLLTFWLGNVLRTTTACTFSTSPLPKVDREWRALYILTWKCASRHNSVHFFDITTSKSALAGCILYILTWKRASRHNGVHFFDITTSKSARTWCLLHILTWKCASRHNGMHFFDISTSKSGPNMVCFLNFDFQTRFAPQRRALFRHLNFQKWSDVGVLCTFWLGNVLGATTACNFSSHMTTWLRTRRFSEPTFRPYFSTLRSHKSFKKRSVSWRSYLFAHLHLLSSHSFSSLIFSLLLVSSLTLPTSAFPSVHIVGRLLNFLRLYGVYIYIYTILYIRYIRGTYSKSLDPGRSTTWNRKPQKPMS